MRRLVAASLRGARFDKTIMRGIDAERVIETFVQKGFDVIFTTSFGFMDPTLNVAKKYPDKVFMHCSGFKTADNVGTYFGRMYQPRYLTGMIAGKMTESNILGYVAAHPIPEVIRGINAFTLGVQSVNPQAEVRVVWTQTWFDPGIERDAADSLLDVGADVLAMHQDAPATLQAAEARGAFVIGYNSDMRDFAPNAFLTAPVWNWGPLYSKIAQEVKDGTWKSESIWWGMKEEMYDGSPYGFKIMHDAGVNIVINSDSADEGRYLYLNAAKALKYNDLPDEVALKWITLNPAKALEMDGRVGSIEVGKDGDIAVFDKYPLDSTTKVVLTIIEGKVYFDYAKDSVTVRETDQ